MSLINEFKDLLLITRQFIEQEWPNHKIASSTHFVQPQKKREPNLLAYSTQPVLMPNKNEGLISNQEVKPSSNLSSLSQDLKHSDPKVNKNDVHLTEQISSFVLEPLAHPLEDMFVDVRKNIKHLFPNLVHFDETLNDIKAIEIKSKWRLKTHDEMCIILSFEEGVHEKEFLNNLARALTVYAIPTDVIEVNSREKIEWENLIGDKPIKLVITPLNPLKRTCLSESIKMSTQKGQFFFLQVPCFEIIQATNYLNDINLKAELWKSLRNYLKI
jgi:hypothetical protein